MKKNPIKVLPKRYIFAMVLLSCVAWFASSVFLGAVSPEARVGCFGFFEQSACVINWKWRYSSTDTAIFLCSICAVPVGLWLCWKKLSSGLFFSAGFALFWIPYGFLIALGWSMKN
jgi:hypothetical protein